jgi:hypothetical protein
MNPKFRNGVTNIGILCGFASLDEAGRLRVHQTACRENALPLELSPEVRGPEYDYEPVLAIYRAEPTPDPKMPVFRALHVTRMPRSLRPKTFAWNSRAWPLNLAFYPFRPDKAGELTADLAAALVEQPALPEWLVEACAQDDLLAELLARPSGNKHLPNRLILTGEVQPQALVHVDAPLDESEGSVYLAAQVRQPGDRHSIEVRLHPGLEGYTFWARALEKGGARGYPATLVIKPWLRVAHENECVTRSALELRVLEANVVAPADLAEV